MLLLNNTKGKNIDFKSIGFTPVRLFRTAHYYQYDREKNEFKNYERHRLREYIRDYLENDELAVLDIEHLRHNLAIYDASEVSESLAELIQVVQDFREFCPNRRVGYYRLIPIRDFWAPINYHFAKSNPRHAKSRKYRQSYYKWKRANRRLMNTPNESHRGLADVVDFVAPSVYILYRNTGISNPMEDPRIRDQWPVYCTENIYEARKYNKPVYAYVMREYHPSGVEGRQILPIEPEVVRFQLDTLEDLDVDGVIFFSIREFGPDDMWWNAVEQWVTTSRPEPPDIDGESE